jgi:hypothetical protein
MITENQPGSTRRVELYEMLDLIDKSDDVKGTIQKFGKQYSSFTDYLRCVFDDRIEFLLPEGKPPYRPAPPQSVPSTWHKKHMDLKYFVKIGVTDGMSQIKREMKFIEVLESVHPEDAVILLDMIQKKTPSKKLTEEVVKEALPKLFE